MPYAFPPQSSQVDDIIAQVERAKDDLQFNTRLAQHIHRTLPRFGVTNPNDLDEAERYLPRIVETFINPTIQKIVLAKYSSKGQQFFYNMPSPSKLSPSIGRYNVSLLSDVKPFKSDAETIVRTIYDEKAVIQCKSAAISNMLVYIFWCQPKYFYARGHQAHFENAIGPLKIRRDAAI